MSGLTKTEIQKVFSKGKKIKSRYFLFYYLPFKELKLSPVVSKKISKKAVVRNKIKRRIRHIGNEILNEGMWAVVALKDVSETEFENLKHEFEKIYKKIN